LSGETVIAEAAQQDDTAETTWVVDVAENIDAAERT
jgi:hypothetical protein